MMMKQATGMEPMLFLSMSQDQLREGFVSVMQKSYEADAYFNRLDAQFIDGHFKFVMHGLSYWWTHPWAWAKRFVGNYVKFIVVAWRLSRFIKNDTLRSRYREQLARIVASRGFEPHVLFIYSIKVAMHYHYAEIVRTLTQRTDSDGSMPDAGRSFSRLKHSTQVRALAS